ncbi:MAG: hypothetical protein Q8K78_09895 [Planctomycetaceae bacterium]|nr:hypothetical protein [Planctomycetaceae bacterium]
MRNRLRTVVWRELPFSARRAILGSVRALDDFERAVIYFWRNLYYSPAWLFVAISGSVGIVLTILLFISLSKELMARAEGRTALQRIEVADLDPTLPPRWDTRLCLENGSLAAVPYDAEFAFGRSLPPLRVSRPVEPPPVRESVAIAPSLPAEPPRLAPPRLEPYVEMLRQPQEPVIRPEILTARSELEELNLRDVTRQPDGWDEGRNHPLVAKKAPPAYAGDPDLNVAIPEDEDVWSDLTAWPNRAEIGMRIELHAPEQAAVGQAGRSHVLIRNDGEDTIHRIELRESLPLLPLVTGATPEARLRDNLIDREFRRLHPNRERNLSLAWFARENGDYHHEAQVLAETVVSATVLVEAGAQPRTVEPDPIAEEPVEVLITPEPRRAPEPRPEPVRVRPPRPVPAEPAPVEESDPAPMVAPPPTTVTIPPRRRDPIPAVACRVKPTSTVKLNEVVELKVEVQNTGETPLHNVRIWADVPQSLRHRHGTKLEYPVGKLDPGQVHHSVLRVVGEKAGAAVAAFRVVSDENIRADAKGQVAVTVPKPMKPTPIAKPAKPPLTTPTCPCECQQSQVTWAGYEF